MASETRLRLVLTLAAEKAAAGLKRLGQGSTASAQALRKTQGALRDLQAQAKALREFESNRNILDGARQQLDMAKKVGLTGTAMKRLTADYEKQLAVVKRLNGAMYDKGWGNLGTTQKKLAADIAATNARLEAQRKHLERLAKLRTSTQAMALKGAAITGAGYAAQYAGRRGVETVMGPVQQFMAHEDAMLGIARQVPGARDEMGKLTKVYRDAEEAVRGLSREIPLSTTAIADMMTAAARMEVPTEHLRDQVKLAAEMAIAFDAVPDEIAESMGKVAKNYKIPITEIRDLADAINYLDDNAISKGADIIDYLNRTSGIISIAKMTAAQNAALGSTLLTAGAAPEAAATAVNAMLQRLAAGAQATKKVQSALGQLGLDPRQVAKGITTDAMGTLDSVLQRLQALPEEKRIGAMTYLVGVEHTKTLAQLTSGRGELQRQLALSTGTQASGSMAREAAARYATLSAQWQMAKNAAFNLAAATGETLKPALIDVKNTVAPLLERTRQWAQTHPQLVATLLKGALAVSAFTFAAGALLITLGIVVAQVALLRHLVGANVGLLAGGLGNLLGIARSLGTVFMIAGRAALAFLFTPLGAALALLAGAAFLVWRNWDGIKGGLAIIWQQITDGVSTLWTDITGAAARFTEAGANLMRGLANGILSGVAWVKDTVVGVASDVATWFAEKLRIHSPSRVFMALGQNIPEGAALGIERGTALLRGATLAMATAPMMAAAGGMGAPLMAAGAGAGGASVAGSTYSITINAPAGADPQAIARAVSAELDRRERGQRSRVLSQLADIDG